MEQNYSRYTSAQKQRINTKTNFPSNNEFEKSTTENNIRNKLDNAFNDLDSLRKSLNQIKVKANLTKDKQRLLNLSPSSLNNSRTNNYEDIRTIIKSKQNSKSRSKSINKSKKKIK
jgi:hypothetical protein